MNEPTLLTKMKTPKLLCTR